MSESTEGMMHAADGSSHSKQFSVSTSGVVPPTPMLPEDIGRQTALLLIEEIVRVSQGRRHQYSRQKTDVQNCSIIQLSFFLRVGNTDNISQKKGIKKTTKKQTKTKQQNIVWICKTHCLCIAGIVLYKHMYLYTIGVRI